MQLVFQFILKMVSGIGVSPLCNSVKFFHFQPWQTMSLWRLFCAQGVVMLEQVWASIVALKLNCNAKALKDVLYN